MNDKSTDYKQKLLFPRILAKKKSNCFNGRYSIIKVKSQMQTEHNYWC